MAAGLLGRTSIEDAGGPALVAAVDDDPDPAVRVAALEALARLRRPADRRRRRAGLPRPTTIPRPRGRGPGAGRGRPRPAGDRWRCRSIDELAADPSPGRARGDRLALRRARPRGRLRADLRRPARRDAARPTEWPASMRSAGSAARCRTGRPRASWPTRRRGSARRPLDALAASARTPEVALDVAIAPSTTTPRSSARRPPRRSRGRDRAPPGVLDVLAGGSQRAQDAALSALDGHGPEVRDA